jgi:uncharacterized heparinase superfamily protein
MISMGYKELRHNPDYTKPLMTDETFLRDELDLNRPGMEDVRRLILSGKAEEARDAYLHLITQDTVKRYYFGVQAVPELMAYAQEAYILDEEARQAIREADLITEGSLPLPKGKRVDFGKGAYDWNSWLYDSSQYQLHLTRFVYVKHLARAYCLTGDEKYAECFNKMMDHFIEDCPTPVDGTFRVQHCTWDPLSVGVRLFMLPEAFITFFGSPSFTPEVKMKMIKSFHQHGDYVRKYHASHGNHVCMQLRGLIQVALLLPELKVSKQWLAYGLGELPGYIHQNVYEDGVQFEASPNYHLVVMRDLYELVPLFRALELPTEQYNEILESMFAVMMHLITPDGQLARFGDTDLHSENELRSVMSLGAYLFERGDFKYVGHEKLPFSLLWRLGPGAAERYNRLEAVPPRDTLACFPIGGYLVSRENWSRNAMHMAMRAGVGINGHAHSDALSFVLYANGRELIADSGMGLFEWNKERKYIVSTRAHNTVVVDGEDQHVRSLHWNSPPTAACKIWDVRTNGQYDYFTASHYGYTRYEDPVIHTRKVLFVKNRYWLVVDLFEAKAQHRYDQYYHLPVGESTADWSSRQIRTNLAEANALLVFPTGRHSEDDRLMLESGLLFLNGEYKVNPVVRRSLSAAGRAAMETVIVPYGSLMPKVEVHRLPAQLDGRDLEPWEATALRIETEEFTDDICLYHDHIAVDAYLDHTGNPVEEALLPKPRPIGTLYFGGASYQEDTILKHSPNRRE